MPSDRRRPDRPRHGRWCSRAPAGSCARTDACRRSWRPRPRSSAPRLAGSAGPRPRRRSRGAAKRIALFRTIAEAAAGADFVQECGPETVAEKIAIFKAIDAAVPARAIIASSSSAIAASKFTRHLKGRARCLVAHPVNPPHLVPIVELCPAPWTAPKTVSAARRIYERVGQVPILVRREIEGFILNRLQGALLAEAFRLIGPEDDRVGGLVADQVADRATPVPALPARR